MECPPVGRRGHSLESASWSMEIIFDKYHIFYLIHISVVIVSVLVVKIYGNNFTEYTHSFGISFLGEEK